MPILFFHNLQTKNFSTHYFLGEEGGLLGVAGCFLSLRANSNRVFPYMISHAFLGCFLGVAIQTLAPEYQRGAYFVMLYFLTLLFCQLPIYCFPS